MKRFLACLTILAIPALVFGQALTTGRIAGHITDEEGAPVADARLEFTSEAMPGERVQRSDDNGFYLAALLPVGDYAVEISAPGKRTVNMWLRVKMGQTAPLDVTMEAGDVMTERVTVFGTATAMTTTTLGENFNYDKGVEELPIMDRDIESVAQFAPNISFGPTPGTLSIAGAPSYDTTVLLDGAEISDPYFGSAAPLFLEDAIEEVQVLTGGVSARYGRFQGGVVNAITKSGGNRFSGSVRAEFGREDWNQKTPFGEDQSDDLNELYQATVGGYVLKDHLWFFGGFRGAPVDDVTRTTIGSQESFTTTEDEDRWQIKLTGAINPRHTISVSYLDSERDLTNRAGLPAGDSFAITDREDPRDTTTVSYQGVLSDRMFLDVSATDKDVSIRSGGSKATSPAFPQGRSPFLDFFVPGFAIYNNHWWDPDDPSVRDNQTAAANMAHVLSAGSWGDHTIEYGIQYVKSETSGLNNQSPTGFNLLNYDAFFGPNMFADCDSLPCTFNMLSYPAGISYRWQAIPHGTLEQEIESTAVYLQDSWQWNDWRFDIGLRYEEYDLSSSPFDSLDTDFDEISPRLGVSYNLNKGWQLQASWGRYVSRFNDNVGSSISGVGGAPYVVSIYTGPDVADQSYEQMEAILRDDANFGIVTFINDPEQPVRFAGGGITAPFADDLNISIKRALPKNQGSVSLTFTHREYKDLLDDFVGDEGARTVTDPFSAAPLPFDLVRWDNSSVAEREYDAFTMAFDYRPGANWNVGGNWTYSWTEGNYEGEGRNTPASGSIIGDYDRSVDLALAIPYGSLDEDIRNRVNAFGSYRLDFDRAGALTLGSTLIYEDPRNWSKTGGVSFAADPRGVYLNNQGLYTGFAEGRGEESFNSWWAMDVSGRYQFQIYKDVAVWAKLSIQNVFNNDEAVEWQTSGSFNDNGFWKATGNCHPTDGPDEDCTSWGRIRNEGDYQVPRTYLFTLGLTF